MIKRRLLIQPKESFTGWEHLELWILTVLILKVTISSLFRLTHTFTVMFGSLSTRVLSSVAAIAFFWVLFIWPLKFRTRLLYYSQILVMCSVLSFGLLQASKLDLLRKYLAVLAVIYFHKGLHATSFQDSVIHLWYLFIYYSVIIIILKVYVFKIILWISIHSQGFKTCQCVLSQLRTNSKTRAVLARCEFIECVVGRKFS